MNTRRRQKQEPTFRSVNGIGLGSVVVWGGVMAIAAFASVSTAIKLRRRKTHHPPSPPPLPPDLINRTPEMKQEESECLGKGLHDLILRDLKGKAEATMDVAGTRETDSIDGMMKRNPILEEEPVLGDDRCVNHEEYHETNPDQDEKEKGEDGKIISDSFEEETKRGACEEEVDEITMEEYRAAEDDSTEEEEEEEEEEEDSDDISESKRISSRIEGGQLMEEVKSESEKENRNEDEDEEEEDETEEEETESEEAGDSSTSSNVEEVWPSESDREMCVHLKSTHMGLTDDPKQLKRKTRGNRIDDDDDNQSREAMVGSSMSEILMTKNWQKLRIMIVMILAMALLLSLVNTFQMPLCQKDKFSE